MKGTLLPTTMDPHAVVVPTPIAALAHAPCHVAPPALCNVLQAVRDEAGCRYLQDTLNVCDSAVVLNQGHVLATGTIAELRSRYGGAHKMRLVTDGGPAHVVTLLQGEDWASEVTVDDDAVVFAVNDADRVGRALPG